MGTPDTKLSDLIDLVRSWIPRRSEPVNLSRDFWMPDQSCLVCYECDSPFTIFNRRHHCRLCGRVFCGNCTENSIPANSEEHRNAREDRERIRVCNYCFKQWEQAIAGEVNGTATEPTPGLSHSPSAASLVSSKSSCTCNSSSTTSASTPYSTGPYQHVPYCDRFVEMDQTEVEQGDVTSSRSIQQCEGDTSSNNFFSSNRSDDESDEYGMYHMQYGSVSTRRDVDNLYLPYGSHPDEDNTDAQEERYSSFPNIVMDETKGNDEETDGSAGPNIVSEATVHEDAEPVDFENNWLLWLPPEPADKEDEREALMLDEDDGEGASGEWGYPRSTNSFGNEEYRNKDKSGEEHRHAMKNVLESHFRVLIAQLLQVENLPTINEEGRDNWLDIITCLSWEAATLLKPDMSKGGGMDPGGYVKVKCIACGHPSESKVVKGVVCKKNIAHRRMTSKIARPRFLILGGALEYQRVSNHLSSVDTLLQQEMDHLKMAVAKIDAHHPNILLVEKSVSRYAQDYILEKDISLVLNIKRPLLERLARCTGAQIIPSVDHLTSPKLGYCDAFHVDKFFEEHGSAGQGGKKLTKTLMFFEGCPKPFGCTVLLKGANGDDLKKVKHVVQYGIFAAYHLALETSFLADEGASLPELPLKSPIKVALPDKATAIERSISTISGFPSTPGPKTLDSQPEGEVDSANRSLTSESMSTRLPHSASSLTEGPSDQNIYDRSALTISVSQSKTFGNIYGAENIGSSFQDMKTDLVSVNSPDNMNQNYGQAIYEMAATKKDEFNISPEMGSAKEEFSSSAAPSPSDHQSILVSLSTRCVWKGTVCERAHLFRIKYYGSFDKPLGRFLRDHLLDQSYRCNSCELSSEAHVHCYTHRQGSLTISVRKLQDINLPGERDGKIWMWHRCLKCPRKDGFPQATQRVVMSDAAWGLSFGKFLELSFSNHAAASRVANCGHSLHRDCLRFYGYGRMVACFRYASINVLSVYLPPPKLDFSFSTQEWIEKEVKEIRDRAKLLFTEVSAALNRMGDKLHSVGQMADNPKASNVESLLEESEILLLKDKQEIEESLGKVLSGHVKAIDILDINKLRKQIIHLSYTWDQHLISAGKMVREVISNSTKLSEKTADPKPNPAKGSSTSSDSLLMVEKSDPTLTQIAQRNESIKERDADQEMKHSEVDRAYLSASEDIGMSDSLGCEKVVRKALSEGEFPVLDLSDTLEAAWTGESLSQPPEDKPTPESVPPSPSTGFSKSSSFKAFIPTISRSLNLPSSPKPKLVEYSPLYVQSFWESERQSGAKLLLPSNDTVIPVYEDEPTSIISFALVSNEYLFQSLNGEKPKDGLSSTTSLPLFDSVSLLSFSSLDESSWDPTKSFASTTTDESLLRSPQNPDPLSSTRDLHIRISFADENPQGKVKYGVVCYYAKQFEALRRICCPSEMDYVRSLSRCKKWGAQGGKSNVFFAKTLDDRFIIKQVTKTELESFIKFAPSYFKYLSESIGSGSPTCLAKILGIYQVSTKHLKGGKETKMDVLVMENLLFQRNIMRLYDLKGSSRSRYNPDTSGSNKVLLDQNLIEAMPTSPIFVGNKAKRLLERAVWNDTAFLASIDVMDYSLLVGIDEEKHELVLGIIDFMRQYTWDKHLETWVKTSAILGGSKAESPTVISPQMYKKRFRKAMTAYFLMVPDQWSPPTIIPSRSQTDLNEEDGTAAD